MERPIQYILCGLPFSGKTTLGKKLSKHLGFEHINLDQIRAEIGYDSVPEDNISDRIWNNIFEEANKRLIRALKKGKSVVNETAWVTKKWRDRVRKVAEKEGYSTKIIYLKIPESIVRKRWQQNRIDTQRYDTPDDEFDEYIRDFEEPTEEESLIIFDETLPIDEWISKHFGVK